jgi:isoquinoline 1-oxidoreductase alpha subunit
MVNFQLNERAASAQADGQTPLLWVVRDELGLKGSKFGCGMGLCGACTMHVDGQAVRSCVTPLAAVQGKSVKTIEGLGSLEAPSRLQRLWAEMGVAQCGYCQSGQLMAAAALLQQNPQPSDADIDAAMRGNICRCGTYPRIKQAIRAAAAQGVKA